MLPSWVRAGLGHQSPSDPRRRLQAIIAVMACVILYLVIYPRGRYPPESALEGARRTSSEWLVNSHDFRSPPPFRTPDNMLEMPSPIPPRREGDVVPDVVHLTYGLKDDGGRGPEFTYTNYLAMRSILLRLKPAKLFFHYHYEPEGPWWDAVKPHLTMHKVAPVPTEIFGNPITNFAHASDVVRMYAIQQTGGIYLDMDVIVIRDFDDLLSYPTTLGLELDYFPMADQLNLNPAGLCNGVIIAAPNAPFINRWLDRYQEFNGTEWATHSVHLPWVLARQNPLEIQVLSHKAFFNPLWTWQDIDYIHLANVHDFYYSGAYAYHIWNTARKYLDLLTPTFIRRQDTSFTRLVYPLMGPDDDRLYDEWIAWSSDHTRSVKSY